MPPCCIHTLLFVPLMLFIFLPCTCFATAPTRRRLRAKYNLPAGECCEPCNDWLVHLVPCIRWAATGAAGRAIHARCPPP
jgi:hypothetical protein